MRAYAPMRRVRQVWGQVDKVDTVLKEKRKAGLSEKLRSPECAEHRARGLELQRERMRLHPPLLPETGSVGQARVRMAQSTKSLAISETPLSRENVKSDWRSPLISPRTLVWPDWVTTRN